MSRIAYCEACSMQNHGAKTRIALEHTCGLETGAVPQIESVEIINWKDVVSQFGLSITTAGCLSAPQLSKELRKKVLENAENHIFIECNTKSEAVACFELRKRNGVNIWYEYVGTAN